jgi:hypothetical protein
VKFHAALLAVAVAVAVSAGATQATVTDVNLSLSESSPYAYVSGSTLYYSPNSGSFTVTVTASTDSTGIASVAFPTVFGSDSDTDVTSPFSHVYDFTSGATASGSMTVTVTDDAADTDTADFTVTPDTAPTVSNSAPTEVTGAGDQFWDSGTDTLWFRPAGSGSFTLNATASDAQTGITQVAFPDVSATSGWSTSTGGTDTGSPYASPVAYTWTSGAAAPGAKTVTATNGTGMTATDTVTIAADSTAPTGQTVSLSGGPWYSTLSVPLTLGAGSDAGAGVDTTRGIVERASATLTNGACGTFGTFATVTLTGGADTGVTSGSCYRYQYKAADNVGNVSTASAASADAKVDATPPTTPSLLVTGFTNSAASGNVVYYRPGGSGRFTVTAASTDGESGIASYTFPTVAGFAVTGSGPSRIYSFTNAPSAPSAPVTVTVTNGSGLVSPGASFTLVPDSTPPTVKVRCNGKPCLRTAYRKAVTVTLSAADGPGSGVDAIRYTTDGRTPTMTAGADYSRSFTVDTVTHLKIRAYDKAGNASRVTAITIRSLADRLVFTAPTLVKVAVKSRYLQARVRSSLRATVTAVMSGRGLKAPHTWRFLIGPGATLVQFRLPPAIERPGHYTVVWKVRSATSSVTRTTRVVLGRPAKGR